MTKKLKQIAFYYGFNATGYNIIEDDKVIIGVDIGIKIKPYKNDKEVKFLKEPLKIKNQNLDDVFNVKFDEKNFFTIKQNKKAYKTFCKRYDWQKIEYEVIEYFYIFFRYENGEMITTLPGCSDSPVADMREISKKDFQIFIEKYVKEFNNSDNFHPSCTGYRMI